MRCYALQTVADVRADTDGGSDLEDIRQKKRKDADGKCTRECGMGDEHKLCGAAPPRRLTSIRADSSGT